MTFLTKVFVTLRGVSDHPLYRRNRLRAVIKFCLAQVGARLIPGDVCAPFPNQTRLIVPPTMIGAPHFIMPGLCEFDTMSFVLHFLRRDDLFVDGGAFIGAYTVLASGAIQSRTVAFEPSPSAFDALTRNVCLNDLKDRVTLFNAALGREEGQMCFTEGLGSENYICSNSAVGNTIKVKVTTLDNALTGLSPTLMKFDVEGFEREVLAGGSKTLANPLLSAFIIERNRSANRYGSDEDALHTHIRSMSFLPCAYFPMDRVLRKLSPDDEGNIIYLRDFSYVQQRLREAEPYRFLGHSV